MVWDELHRQKQRVWQALIIMIDSEKLTPETQEFLHSILWEIMKVNDLSPIRIYTEIFAIKLTLKNTSEVIKKYIFTHLQLSCVKPQIEASLLVILGYTFE